MQLKRTMTDQEIKKIGKEEKTLLFVEFLNVIVEKINRLKILIVLNTNSHSN